MKMMGYMNDKAKYQAILQEIARRKMILKKPDANSIKKSEDYNDWGVKLDNLLDGHLKKIQKDNFLDDIPIAPTSTRNMNSTNHQQIDFLTGDLIPTIPTPTPSITNFASTNMGKYQQQQ